LDTNVTERIRSLINNSSLSAGEFADSIGINRSRLSHILTGRNYPSLEIVAAILIKYPDIDSEWLILGKDVRDNKSLKIETGSEHSENKGKQIERVKTKSNPQIALDITAFQPELKEIILLYGNNTFSVYKQEK
jgi:transcriptional regulator with XRE-family HTH domain